MPALPLRTAVRSKRALLAEEHGRHACVLSGCGTRTGCLLVGRQPGMGVFERSVVLLLEHSDKAGSVGLLLNVPAPLLVNDAGLDSPAVKGDALELSLTRRNRCCKSACQSDGQGCHCFLYPKLLDNFRVVTL